MFGRQEREKRARATLRCSFCNKTDDEVRKLIAGPTVFICDECVDVCVDIIRDDAAASGTTSPEAPVPTGAPWPAKVWCALCRMPLVLEEALAIPERGVICGPCVAAVRATTLAADDGPTGVEDDGPS
jgi:hypothetical protein